MTGNTPWEAAREAFRIESDAILHALEQIPEEAFMKAVDVLKDAPRIAASGCGHSGICCMHFAHLMCCIERPARFISPAEAVHGGLGYMKKGDVMLLVSRGGGLSGSIQDQGLIPGGDLLIRKDPDGFPVKKLTDGVVHKGFLL